jgi:two-component system, OmpR family, response regulator
MNPIRVLVVDDEAYITRLLKLNLERTRRFVVQTENAGLNALSAAQQFKPDVVILDVMMPDIDGGDVANVLRTDPELRNVPVIFLTAAVKPEEITVRNGRIGGFPYIAKPLNIRGIIEAIDRCLSERALAA